jgi:putative flippase GtrA
MNGWVRWVKFNAVGAVGIAVQLGTVAVLKTGFHIDYLFATALAVEAAVLHNFIWHEAFTWADRKAKDRLSRMLKFNLTTGIFSIAGNLALTKLLVEIGINYLAANAISIAVCSAINFFLNDRLVFTVNNGRSRSETCASE